MRIAGQVGLLNYQVFIEFNLLGAPVNVGHYARLMK